MKRMSANDAKQRFGEVLDAAQRAPVIIERHGRPKAIVLSYDEYQERQQLKLEALKQDLKQGLDDIAAGRVGPLDLDKIKRSARKKMARNVSEAKRVRASL